MSVVIKVRAEQRIDCEADHITTPGKRTARPVDRTGDSELAPPQDAAEEAKPRGK
jgi:hypothetical protein